VFCCLSYRFNLFMFGMNRLESGCRYEDDPAGDDANDTLFGRQYGGGGGGGRGAGRDLGEYAAPFPEHGKMLEVSGMMENAATAARGGTRAAMGDQHGHHHTHTYAATQGHTLVMGSLGSADSGPIHAAEVESRESSTAGDEGDRLDDGGGGVGQHPVPWTPPVSRSAPDLATNNSNSSAHGQNATGGYPRSKSMVSDRDPSAGQPN
jgi:hypothetical protein